MDEKQNYFNIGKLTAEIEKNIAATEDGQLTGQVLNQWYVLIQLAQAQQLVVIASSLKRIEKTFRVVPDVSKCASCGGPVDADGYCDPCAEKASGGSNDEWPESEF